MTVLHPEEAKPNLDHDEWTNPCYCAQLNLTQGPSLRLEKKQGVFIPLTAIQKSPHHMWLCSTKILKPREKTKPLFVIDRKGNIHNVKIKLGLKDSH